MQTSYQGGDGTTHRGRRGRPRGDPPGSGFARCVSGRRAGDTGRNDGSRRPDAICRRFSSTGWAPASRHPTAVTLPRRRAPTRRVVHHRARGRSGPPPTGSWGVSRPCRPKRDRTARLRPIASLLEPDRAHPIPAGYHRVSGGMARGGRDGAPDRRSHRAPTPSRGWGVFLPLHAVRTDRDWGLGSYAGPGRAGAVDR